MFPDWLSWSVSFKYGGSILLVGPHYMLECMADYLLTMLAAKIDIPELQLKHGS